jgi:malonate transporter
MSTFLQHVELAAPLFVLVLVGYLLMRVWHWPQAMSENLSRFVFSVALPAMLFRLMSESRSCRRSIRGCCWPFSAAA